MRFDEYRALVSEIVDPSATDFANWCGQRGDSMANTSRYSHLRDILMDENDSNTITSLFVTRTGYVRHPDPKMPDDWKETDSPTDQCLPYYLCGDQVVKAQMKLRIRNAGWKTGNSDLVSPLLYSVLVNSQWKINFCLLGQLALFALSFRWSDSKKSMESSADASADYLNWFHALPLASPWVRKVVNKNHLREKIHHYFRNEPNSVWLTDMYDLAIEEVLK